MSPTGRRETPENRWYRRRWRRTSGTRARRTATKTTQKQQQQQQENNVINNADTSHLTFQQHATRWRQLHATIEPVSNGNTNTKMGASALQMRQMRCRHQVKTTSSDQLFFQLGY